MTATWTSSQFGFEILDEQKLFEIHVASCTSISRDITIGAECFYDPDSDGVLDLLQSL